jgi:hypothetical protein
VFGSREHTTFQGVLDEFLRADQACRCARVASASPAR